MAEEDNSIDTHDMLDPADRERLNAAHTEAAETANTLAISYLRSRQEAFRRLFIGKPMDGDRELVLEDLARFCCANATTFHPDQRIHLLLTGRQEVWLRIQEYLTVPFDDLVNRRNKILTGADNDV